MYSGLEFLEIYKAEKLFFGIENYKNTKLKKLRYKTEKVVL